MKIPALIALAAASSAALAAAATPPRRAGGPSLDASALRFGEAAFVLVGTVIGTDGHARDPEVLYVLAAKDRKRRIVDAVTSNVLSQRYEPGTRDGRPVATDYTYRVFLELAKGNDSPRALLTRQIEAGAAAGEPSYQLAASIVLGNGAGDASAAARAGLVEAQLWLGRSASRTGRHEEALRSLAQAAASGLPDARVAYGLELLREREPPLQKVRALLAEAAAAEDEYFLRHALAELACSVQPGARDGAAAAAIAKRIDLEGASDPLTAEAVAQGLAAGGDFEAAARAQRLAIDAARRLKWDVRTMQERADAYARRQGCAGDIFARAIADSGP
jgi:hypothetical protein